MSSGVTYRAFLLRVWREAGAPWRASLEDPRTGQRRAFASLEQLAAYLAEAAATGFPAAPEPPAPADPCAGEPPNLLT